MTDTATTIATAAADAVKPTLDTIIANVKSKLGEAQAGALTPVIQQYGPAFVAMSAAEVWAFIALAVKGDPYKTYQAILAKLPDNALNDEWTKLNANWATANATNAASVAWQRDALGALLKALVGIAAAQVAL